MKKFFPLFFILSLFFSCSHNDTPEIPEYFEQPLVCVFYPEDGLGDYTYNDQINLGITMAAENHNLLQIGYSPFNTDDAAFYLDYILNEIKNRPLTNKPILCFFVGTDYLSILEKNELFMSGLPVTTVFFDVMESDIPDSLKDKVHSVFIPYYGACYLAGKTAAKVKSNNDSIEKTLIMLPDQTNTLLFKYSQCFLKGMGEEPPVSINEVPPLFKPNTPTNKSELNLDTPYSYSILTGTLDPNIFNLNGFNMAEVAYLVSKNYHTQLSKTDFSSIILPLCGGSSLGVIHQSQEIKDDLRFSIIGIDIDMFPYNPMAVPFSIIKDTNRVAIEIIEQWLSSTQNSRETFPKSQTKTFRDGYTFISSKHLELLPSDSENEEAASFEDNILKETK